MISTPCPRGDFQVAFTLVRPGPNKPKQWGGCSVYRGSFVDLQLLTGETEHAPNKQAKLKV